MTKTFVPFSHVSKNYPFNSIIGEINSGITTRKKERRDYAKMITNVCYTFQFEPTSVGKPLKDEKWIIAMQ